MSIRYAIGPGNGVYHIVMKNESETLCGLRVSRFKSQHVLHLVSDISDVDSICKHCERLERSSQAGHGQ